MSKFGNAVQRKRPSPEAVEDFGKKAGTGATTEADLRKVTIRMPAKVRIALNAKAAMEETSVQELLIEAMYRAYPELRS